MFIINGFRDLKRIRRLHSWSKKLATGGSVKVAGLRACGGQILLVFIKLTQLEINIRDNGQFPIT